MRVFLCVVLLLAVTGTLLIVTSGKHPGTFHLKTEIIPLGSLQQIEPLTTTLVKPRLYTNISGLEKLPTQQAKDVFVAAILPSVLVAKHEIEQRREQVLQLRKKEQWTFTDSSFYSDLIYRYKANDIDDLISRLGTLPSSIVLAQAAVESGWGTSRFFLEANNVFGIWSFNPDEARIMAHKTRDKKVIYLRAYPDIAKSIIDYFEILARSRSYKSLRVARLQTADAYALLPHLRNYSELRSRYTRQLRAIIRKNNLTMYDSYRIDPEYLIED